MRKLRKALFGQKDAFETHEKHFSSKKPLSGFTKNTFQAKSHFRDLRKALSKLKVTFGIYESVFSFQECLSGNPFTIIICRIYNYIIGK